MSAGQLAQGWYRDPYAIHELRYFSAGLPTKLVSDDCIESYDPAPEALFTDDELVQALRNTGGADRLTAEQSALPQHMQRAVFDYFDRLIKP